MSLNFACPEAMALGTLATLNLPVFAAVTWGWVGNQAGTDGLVVIVYASW